MTFYFLKTLQPIKVFIYAQYNFFNLILGGVISSSLEVLSALCLSDVQYDSNMKVLNIDKPPPFYVAYVKEVQEIIAIDALKEFNCLWTEHSLQNKPISELSDLLSTRINFCKESISKSKLWSNKLLRQKIIKRGLHILIINLLHSYTNQIA